MKDDQIRAFKKVSCLCGAEVRVDPLNPDKHVTCPVCGNTFAFVVTPEPGKRQPRITLVLSRAAMKTEGESLANLKKEAPKEAPKAPAKAVTRVGKKSGAKTIKAVMGQCECGTTFPLEDTGELTSLQSCPDCKRVYHVVFKIETATSSKSAIIVPQKPIVHRGRTMVKPQKGATQVPKPAADDAGSRVTDFFTPARKARTRVTKAAPKPKAPPEIPPGAQGVPCDCGEIFVVRRRDVGAELTCAGCGKISTFEEARDPQTLAPILRVRRD